MESSTSALPPSPPPAESSTSALPPSPPSAEPSRTLNLSKIGANFFSASLKAIIPLTAVLIILSLAGVINHSNPVALPASASTSNHVALPASASASLCNPTEQRFSNSSAEECQKVHRKFASGSVLRQQKPTKSPFCACIEQIGIIIPMIPIFCGAFSLLVVDLALYYGGQISDCLLKCLDPNRLRHCGFAFIAVVISLFPIIVTNPFAMASVLVTIVGTISFSALFGNLKFARVITGGSIAQMVVLAITLACKKEIGSASLATVGVVFASFSLGLIEFGSRRFGDIPPLFKSL